MPSYLKKNYEFGTILCIYIYFVQLIYGLIPVWHDLKY
jgi:hypothetical protein